MPIPLAVVGAAFLGTFLSKLVYRVMGALGFAVVSYVGLETLKTQIFSKINTATGSIPADVVNLMGMARVDEYITIVISAYFSLWTMKGITKRLGIK